MTTVKIYTTPTCPWCKKTKAFLKQKKVKFTEYDVVRNEKARQEMIRKSGQMGVPVLDINGKIIIGYDPEGITMTLRSAPRQSGKGKSSPTPQKSPSPKRGIFSLFRRWSNVIR